ncbi:MAG: DUF1109 family protein, partial [Hyphomicrobiales bacterium]
MQTNELIAVMTAGHRPVDTGWLRRATWLCALVALALTALLVLIVLGPRRDLAGAWSTSPVIAKALLGASVAGTALVLFQRSLRPGLTPGPRLPLVILPIALVAAWASVASAQAATNAIGRMTSGSLGPGVSPGRRLRWNSTSA